MDMPRKIANRYLVHEEIGRGGMGVVYRALDEKFDAEVAVKVLSSNMASAGAVARLRREAKLGNLLGRQDGLVRALDWGRLKNGKHYLVIDYVPGAKDLDLRQGPLVTRVRRLREAAALVDKAHTAGVLHRDIKPANFLLDRAGKLHLTDFGIAKRVDDPAAADDDEPLDDDANTLVDVKPGPQLTGKNVGLGTPFFMPPEQFEDAASVDARADVYALGVMLFLALTGEYPFPGKSPPEVYKAVMKARYGSGDPPSVRDHLRTIPAALDRVVARALAPNRDERFATVAELLAALDKANWEAGLKGISPLGSAGASDQATLAAERTAPEFQAPAPTPLPTDHQETVDEDRCPGCGHTPLRGALCPACGADVIALRTQSRLEFKRAEAERQERAQRLQQRREVSGASLDYGGFQIPKIAWFVVGLMVVSGILLNVDWSKTEPDAKPDAADTAGDEPGPDEPVELVDADELTYPEELEGAEARAYELFLSAHGSWLKWTSYENTVDPEAEVLTEVPDLERFESYTLEDPEDGLPTTTCRTRRYTFRCAGDETPEIYARVPAD